MHHNKNLKVKGPPILFQTKEVVFTAADGSTKTVKMNRKERRAAHLYGNNITNIPASH